jgi:hypothetical protein
MDLHFHCNFNGLANFSRSPARFFRSFARPPGFTVSFLYTFPLFPLPILADQPVFLEAAGWLVGDGMAMRPSESSFREKASSAVALARIAEKAPN